MACSGEVHISDVFDQAWFVYWVEIGKRMNIKDTPPTYDELKAWSLVSAYRRHEESLTDFH